MKNMRFANWLKTQRLARRLTQEELEDAARLSRKAVSKYERGETRLPDADTRQRIHDALGTSEDDLVDAKVLRKIQVPGHEPVFVSAENPMRIEDGGATYTATESGERASLASLLDSIPDEAIRPLRQFLEAIRKP